MNTPHKHAALIKAWADGAKIQYRFHDCAPWIDTDKPVWKLCNEYRIKPKMIKYRVALLKGLFNKNPHIMLYFPDMPMPDTHEYFVRWLTDWIEVEV